MSVALDLSSDDDLPHGGADLDDDLPDLRAGAWSSSSSAGHASCCGDVGHRWRTASTAQRRFVLALGAAVALVLAFVLGAAAGGSGSAQQQQQGPNTAPPSSPSSSSSSGSPPPPPSGSSPGGAAWPPGWDRLAADVAAAMDERADPCGDFYEFACGAYAAQPASAPDRVDTRVFAAVADQNAELLARLVTERWPLVAPLHDACVQGSAGAVAASSAAIGGALARLDAAVASAAAASEGSGTSGSGSGSGSAAAHAAVMNVTGWLHRQGADVLFAAGALQNIYASPAWNHFVLEQSGTIVSVFEDDQQLRQLIAALLMLTPATAAQYPTQSAAMAAANLAVDFELSLDNIANGTDWGNITESLVLTTYADLLADTGIDWNTYFSAYIGTGPNAPAQIPTPTETMMITPPTYFNGLNAAMAQIFSTNGLEAFKVYATWRLMLQYLRYDVEFYVAPGGGDESPEAAATRRLVADSVQKIRAFDARRAAARRRGPVQIERFGGLKDLDEAAEAMLDQRQSQPSRADICVGAVNQLLPDFVGHLFSELVLFEGHPKGDVQSLVDGIRDALDTGMDGLSWLDAASRTAAKDKLSAIITMIGHPKVMTAYESLQLNHDSFAADVHAINEFQVDRDLRRVLQPYARANGTWGMSPTVVNAFYSPLANSINFPAGILRYPFFSSTMMPKSLQYARLGYVVGHEITHGFDASGRFWGPQGQYGDWLSPTSGAQYDERAQCVVDLYSAQTIGNTGVHIDGEFNIGENIADLGGVKYAERAWRRFLEVNGDEYHGKRLVPNLANDQLFWVFLGQTWCARGTDAAFVARQQGNPHSPAKNRVNQPLSQSPAFARAFNCPAGSPMAPTSRCSLW